MRSAGAQPHSKGGIGLQLGRQRRDVDDIRDREPAARLEHSERLAKHLRLIGNEIDYTIRDHNVGRDGLTTRMSPSPIGCSSPSRSVQPLQGLRTLELEPWSVL